MATKMRLFLPACTALLLTAAAAVSFARGAEVAVGDLVVTRAWARATPPGTEVGAAYLTIENRGATDDRLLGAEAGFARSISVHQTADENGVATMRPLEAPAVPAGAALEMQPGGIHLMLTGLATPLVAGQGSTITVLFEHAGKVAVPLEIVPLGAEAPASAHHDHPM